MTPEAREEIRRKTAQLTELAAQRDQSAEFRRLEYPNHPDTTTTDEGDIK